MTDVAVTQTFAIGDRVEKISGSSWRGLIVGTYSTRLTPEGYAVESETETGSVQIYPARALRLAALQPRPASTVRAEALEEAARVCDGLARAHRGREGAGPYEIAAIRIRALAEPARGEEG